VSNITYGQQYSLFLFLHPVSQGASSNREFEIKVYMIFSLCGRQFWHARFSIPFSTKDSFHPSCWKWFFPTMTKYPYLLFCAKMQINGFKSNPMAHKIIQIVIYNYW